MKGSVQVSVIKIAGDSLKSGPDILAVEEPLEIRLAFGSHDFLKVQNLAVTMRTPGHDAELALGFIFTEGIINKYSDVSRIEPVFEVCLEEKQNLIQVTLNNDVKPNLIQAERNFYTTSSCGVCGKASINAIRTISSFTPQTWAGDPIDPNLIISLPDILSKQQRVFAETGGLHAAALFGENAELLFVREDIGRHNALDKLIGAALIEKIVPLSHSILILSGRASFELVQKAAMAGIPIIAAVGAPSSLAVSLAKEFGITLVGFLRNNHFNIYSAADRIKMPVHENTY